MTRLLVAEHSPLKQGQHYAEAAGILTGSHAHSHFVFKIGEEGREVLLDPWILFWQIFQNNKNRAGAIRQVEHARSSSGHDVVAPGRHRQADRGLGRHVQDQRGLGSRLDKLKAICANHDLVKRPVWVYQWFDGLDLAHKFLLFKGEINSPFAWNEGDRTVRFDVTTRIEEVEAGYSMEEGDFPVIPPDALGKAWPLGDTGQLLLSRLDVTQINPVATDLLSAKTVYGDAILFRDSERLGLG